MKATLTEERFSDPGWIFERKLDGIRCIAIRDGKGVRLLSRNDLSLNARYPEVAEALEAQRRRRFAIDGEVVAFDRGRTSFEALARRGHRAVKVFLYVFDVLWLDGRDVRALPLRERKRLLRDALDFGGPLRLTAHRNGDGEAYYEEACRKGWEGLIAKRADSPYSTSRSRDWLKFKCDQAQELVIGGFTPPKGSRSDLAAALKEGGAAAVTSEGGARRLSARALLVPLQVALALVLLVGAGLLTRSLARLSGFQAGFDSKGVLTMRFDPSGVSDHDRAKAGVFRRELVERISAIPGVTSAATGRTAPLSSRNMIAIVRQVDEKRFV